MTQEINQEVKEQTLHSTTQSIESIPENQESAQPEMSEIEKEARALGWKSKEERTTEGKDNRFFVSAEEFINRRPLFERLERQNEELKELKELQRKTLVGMASAKKEGYEQALRDLKAQRDVAIQNADLTGVRAAEAQMEAMHSKMQQDPIVQQAQVVDQGPTPEVREFMTRNSSWYNNSTPENQKMVAAALALQNYYIEEARVDQNLPAGAMPKISTKDLFKVIEKDIKQRFAHRFENQRRDAPMAVAKSTVAGNVRKDDLVSRLSQQQKDLGLEFQARNPGYTLEKYANDLERMGLLNK